MVTEAGYVCTTSSRFEVRREGTNDRLVPSLYRQSDRALSSVEVRAQLRLFLPCSPDAQRRASTGFTVLWCARAREIAQAARKMIARKKTA
jgi:hypothetical protein